MTSADTFITVTGISKDFTRRDGRKTTAVDNVSFDIRRGETFGLAGESGGGKSTLGRIVLGLTKPTAGEIIYDGQSVTKLDPKQYRPLRRRMQMVFQNPVGSLNPRKTIGANLELPLINFDFGSRRLRAARVAELLSMVGLSPADASRYPHEFSGGQAQRIGVARALAIEPDFVFLDEPVSALDVSVQAQILNLLKDLQQKLNLTYLFVVHNLNVAHFMCDRSAIMRAGKIVELNTTDELLHNPQEEYTKQLLGAALATSR